MVRMGLIQPVRMPRREQCASASDGAARCYGGGARKCDTGIALKESEAKEGGRRSDSLTMRDAAYQWGVMEGRDPTILFAHPGIL